MKTFFNFSIFTLFFFCLSAYSVIQNVYSSSLNNLYTVEDLEILKNQKNYEEFLLHAKDILPSKRDKNWEDMVLSMGIGFIDFNIKHKKFSKKIFEQIEKLFVWPTLRSDEFFVIKRNRFGLKYLNSCVRDKTNTKLLQSGTQNSLGICIKDLYQFWNSSHQKARTAELGMALGNYLISLDKEADAIQFFMRATLSDFSNFHCKKEMIKKSLFEQVARLNDKGMTYENLKTQVFQIANPACWKVMISDLQKLLMNSDRKVGQNAYLILKFNDALTAVERDVFFTFFILNGPQQGDLYNEAWNGIVKLGKNFSQREKVLKYLKSLDPLPGRIFSMHDRKTKRVLIELFAKNIPEYLDFYARTCLEYLRGLKTFPNGNPTIECHDLYKSVKNTDWVVKNLQREYANLPRI